MKKFSTPYMIWMGVLVAVPIAFMMILSVTITNRDDLSTAVFSFRSFTRLIEPIYLNAFMNSFRLSTIVTLISLMIGYPIAYMLSRSTSRFKSLWLVMIIVPTWSNMLLRIIAWETLFFPTSILNSIGLSLDLIGTDLAIIIGMVSIFLPFMIFPIYAVLDKLDASLEEASADLGASPWQTFIRVTLPLSTSGIISGVIMTFLPSATSFAVPLRLGGGRILLIGNIIETLFRRGNNFNLGSLLSLIVIAVIFIAMRILSKVDAEGETLI
jgi:spermidine/putrescine transport system permease protein